MNELRRSTCTPNGIGEPRPHDRPTQRPFQSSPIAVTVNMPVQTADLPQLKHSLCEKAVNKGMHAPAHVLVSPAGLCQRVGIPHITAFHSILLITSVAAFSVGMHSCVREGTRRLALPSPCSSRTVVFLFQSFCGRHCMDSTTSVVCRSLKWY